MTFNNRTGPICSSEGFCSMLWKGDNDIRHSLSKWNVFMYFFFFFPWKTRGTYSKHKECLFLEQRTGLSFPVRVIVFLFPICCYCLNKTTCHLFIAGTRKYRDTHKAGHSPFREEQTEKDSEDRICNIFPLLLEPVLWGCAHRRMLQGRTPKSSGSRGQRCSCSEGRSRSCLLSVMHRSLC